LPRFPENPNGNVSFRSRIPCSKEKEHLAPLLSGGNVQSDIDVVVGRLPK
jgi:hypothetical protein